MLCDHFKVQFWPHQHLLTAVKDTKASRLHTRDCCCGVFESEMHKWSESLLFFFACLFVCFGELINKESRPVNGQPADTNQCDDEMLGYWTNLFSVFWWIHQRLKEGRMVMKLLLLLLFAADQKGQGNKQQKAANKFVTALRETNVFPLFGFFCFFKGLRKHVGQTSSWQVFTNPVKTLYLARTEWPKAAVCLCVTV